MKIIFHQSRRKPNLPDELIPPEPPMIGIAMPLTNGCIMWSFYSLS
jgi:hypothetical protein